MYTGIVQACLPIEQIERKEDLMSFSVRFPTELLPQLETGASVAVNGVCFTVTTIDGDEVWFDAIKETLALSNIRHIDTGTMVNIERSAKPDTEVGGHIMAGHITGTAPVCQVENSPNNCRMTFQGDPDWMRFVFDKGFLAINGASLTIAAVDRDTHQFAVNLIPETLQRTNFSLLTVDDPVNIEIESQTQVIVETVERVMQERFAAA